MVLCIHPVAAPAMTEGAHRPMKAASAIRAGVPPGQADSNGAMSAPNFKCAAVTAAAHGRVNDCIELILADPTREAADWALMAASVHGQVGVVDTLLCANAAKFVWAARALCAAAAHGQDSCCGPLLRYLVPLRAHKPAEMLRILRMALIHALHACPSSNVSAAAEMLWAELALHATTCGAADSWASVQLALCCAINVSCAPIADKAIDLLRSMPGEQLRSMLSPALSAAGRCGDVSMIARLLWCAKQRGVRPGDVVGAALEQALLRRRRAAVQMLLAALDDSGDIVDVSQDVLDWCAAQAPDLAEWVHASLSVIARPGAPHSQSHPTGGLNFIGGALIDVHDGSVDHGTDLALSRLPQQDELGFVQMCKETADKSLLLRIAGGDAGAWRASILTDIVTAGPHGGKKWLASDVEEAMLLQAAAAGDEGALLGLLVPRIHRPKQKVNLSVPHPCDRLLMAAVGSGSTACVAAVLAHACAPVHGTEVLRVAISGGQTSGMLPLLLEAASLWADCGVPTLSKDPVMLLAQECTRQGNTWATGKLLQWLGLGGGEVLEAEFADFMAHP